MKSADLSVLTHNQLIDAFANLEGEICKAQNSVRGVSKQLNARYENCRAELLRRLENASNAGNSAIPDTVGMTVVLFDLRNATRVRVENVVRIDSTQKRINGHLTNIWFMIAADNHNRSFPMRHYEIETIMK